MADASFNGWANYETWLVKLWFDNDQGLSELVYDYATSISANDEYPEVSLMETLKDWVQEDLSEVMPSCGLYSDLLNAAIQNVDWYELAQSYLEDIH